MTACKVIRSPDYRSGYLACAVFAALGLICAAVGFGWPQASADDICLAQGLVRMGLAYAGLMGFCAIYVGAHQLIDKYA